MNMPLAILNRRRRGFTAFSPAALFALAEPGVWYDPSDLTTLFQDPAGTTPVTTPGQAVALMLDKSRGLVLGAELVTNGDFADPVTTGWAASGSAVLSVVSGRLRVANGATLTGGATYVFSTVAGRSYRWTYFVDAATSGGVVVRARDNTTLTVLHTSTLSSGSGTSSVVFVAQGSTTQIQGVNTSNTIGLYHELDNISVRELPGAHATQATAASRPIYGVVPQGGRRNLLTFTEQFDNAVWTKTSVTVTANAAVAPDGTSTSDKVIPNTGVSGFIDQSVSNLSSAAAYTVSVYAKQAGHRYVELTGDAASSRIPATAYFDLQNGVVSSNPLGTANIISVGNGWFRCSISGTSTSTAARPFVRTSTNGSSPATGNGTDGVFVWGAQLETGSVATPYQRVTTQYDVTEAGVQSLSYLAFDGVDDFMLTGTITPGVDKAQVFAGVRKLLNAIGCISELSADLNANTGSTALFTIATGYETASRGTASVSGSLAASVSASAPTSSVLASTHDIAGDLTALRLNGGTAVNATGDKGTGNFLAYPLYIGRRGGTSLPASMNLYGLITRFGATLDAATIASTEAYVAGKTGIVI